VVVPVRDCGMGAPTYRAPAGRRVLRRRRMTMVTFSEETVGFVALTATELAIEFDLLDGRTRLLRRRPGDPASWKRPATIWLVVTLGEQLHHESRAHRIGPIEARLDLAAVVATVPARCDNPEAIAPGLLAGGEGVFTTLIHDALRAFDQALITHPPFVLVERVVLALSTPPVRWTAAEVAARNAVEASALREAMRQLASLSFEVRDTVLPVEYRLTLSSCELAASVRDDLRERRAEMREATDRDLTLLRRDREQQLTMVDVVVRVAELLQMLPDDARVLIEKQLDQCRSVVSRLDKPEAPCSPS
jgi:hypothetical protein